jgi:hypothetical protein
MQLKLLKPFIGPLDESLLFQLATNLANEDSQWQLFVEQRGDANK